MKKLLSLLAGVCLVTSSSAGVISCGLASHRLDFSSHNNAPDSKGIDIAGLKFTNTNLKYVTNKNWTWDSLESQLFNTLKQGTINGVVPSALQALTQEQVDIEIYNEDTNTYYVNNSTDLDLLAHYNGHLMIEYSIFSNLVSHNTIFGTKKLDLELHAALDLASLDFDSYSYDNTMVDANWQGLFDNTQEYIDSIFSKNKVDYLENSIDYNFAIYVGDNKLSPSESWPINKVGESLTVKLTALSTPRWATGKNQFTISLQQNTIHISDDQKWHFNDSTLNIGNNYQTSSELQAFAFKQYMVDVNKHLNLKEAITTDDLLLSAWKINGEIADNDFSISFNVAPNANATKYQFITGDEITVNETINRGYPSLDGTAMPSNYFAKIDQSVVTDFVVFTNTLSTAFIAANPKLSSATPADLICHLHDKTSTGQEAQNLAQLRTWLQQGDDIYLQFSVNPNSHTLNKQGASDAGILHFAQTIANLQTDVFQQPLNLINLVQSNWQTQLKQDIVAAVNDNPKYDNLGDFLNIDLGTNTYENVKPNAQLDPITLTVDSTKTDQWYGTTTINVDADIAINHQGDENGAFDLSGDNTVIVNKKAYGLTTGNAQHDLLDYNGLNQMTHYLIGDNIAIRGLWLDTQEDLFWSLSKSLEKDTTYYRDHFASIPMSGTTLVYTTLRSDFASGTLSNHRVIIPWVFYTAKLTYTNATDIKISLDDNPPLVNEATNLNGRFIYDVFSN